MQVTTFYSYKGGLGRTLLLAWAARALAQGGAKVIAIDFDLEAPGLAFKLNFPPDAELGGGLIGLLTRFQRGEPPPNSLLDWVRPVPGADGLWLLPAGPLVSSQYWRTLHGLSWEQLFLGPNAQGVRFFHWLRGALEDAFHPDHVLVDARTGVTEMGGAALSLLADQILALVGTSREGLHGTREVLRGVLLGPRSPERTPPRIALVLARMPASLGTESLKSLRNAVRNTICEEADSLTATLDLELPLVVRSEPQLQEDESIALSADELRVHEDYSQVLDWLRGDPVREESAGLRLKLDGSLEDLRRGVALQRELANRQPERYLPDLARALSASGQQLFAQGRQEEAVQLQGEAVDIFRSLAKSDPHAFESVLAASLNNLGNQLADLGRTHDALQAASEVTEIYRRMVAKKPGAFEADLAMAFSNLSARLGSVDSTEDGMRYALEAVQLYRRLPDADSVRAHLAAALNNLGVQYSRLDRREEALSVSNEAVSLYRRLSEDSPTAYESNLATALTNHSVDLSSLGRTDEAVRATQEAVEIRRRLAKVRPEVFEPKLAGSLNNLGVQLADVGRAAEAEQATAEAARILRQHALARPDIFEPDLAMTLQNLSFDRLRLGERDRALAVGREALEIYRILAQRNPAAFGPHLAESLAALGGVLQESDPVSAVQCLGESLRVIIPHLRLSPVRYKRFASSTLRELLEACSRAGARPESELVREVESLLPATTAD